MRFIVCSAALGAAMMGGAAYATSARAGGLADMHAQIAVGAKVCFVDHEHLGHGGRYASRAEAARDATRAWSAFTGFEYGAEWGDFRIAADPRIACTAEDGRGAAIWACKATARPCRSGTGVPLHARRDQMRMPTAHRPLERVWPGDRR